MTIQIEVNDAVVQQIGEERLKQLVRDRVKAEEFRLATYGLRQTLNEAATKGVEWEAEFEQARQETWEEYKRKRDIS